MSEKFFKGFSLEDYRLQVLIDTLEKEKQQCLSRLNEEQHLFKMSIRLPVNGGEEFWRKYGENFHANGDKRERESVTCRLATRKHQDGQDVLTSKSDKSWPSYGERENSTHSPPSQVVKTSEQNTNNLQSGAGSYSREGLRNRSKKGAPSRKEDLKSSAPTLLEILCGDFDSGMLSINGNQNESDFDFVAKEDLSNTCFKNHSYGRLIKKCSALDYDNGMQWDNKEKSTPNTNKGRKCKEGERRLTRDIRSSELKNGSRIYEKPKSAPVKLRSATKTLSKETSITNKSSNLAKKNRLQASSHKWFMERNSNETLQPCYIKKTNKEGKRFLEWAGGREDYRGLHDVAFHTTLGLDEFVNRWQFMERREQTPSQTCDNCMNVPEQKTSERLNRRASVGCYINETTRTKSQQVENANPKGYVEENPLRTRIACSSGSRSSRNSGVQSLLWKKSQDEREKETREKMDQFFAKVERTKNYETKQQRWRCSSGREIATFGDRKTCVEEKSAQKTQKEHGYSRALPWPIEVWISQS